MRLKTLFLKDFRNYREALISFSPTINYIYGLNAQGKSNLLEALSLFITGSSFRTAQLQECIRFSAPSFYLELHFEKDGVEQVLKLGFDGARKRVIHNATPLKSVSSLLSILHGIIFSPEDTLLIKGAPAERRRFLDLQLSKTSPLYLHHLSRYFKAMKQRNSLLRSGAFETIAIWEEQLALSAAFLTLQRKQLIEELTPCCTRNLQLLSQGEEALELTYLSSALSKVEAKSENLKQFFLERFAQLRERERLLGTTLSGPHRDELSVKINGREARNFGSEGQKRSCATALRLAEWGRLHAVVEELPFNCIDDIGVSLDFQREQILLDRVNQGGQIFLTSPREAKELPKRGTLIHLHQAEIINGSTFL
jgi:DNA replication and repair protein RecF